GGERAARISDAERVTRRNKRSAAQGDQCRYCGGARLGIDCAGSQKRRRKEYFGHPAHIEGPGGTRALEKTKAGRSAGRDVLDHQSRRVRRLVWLAGDQSTQCRHYWV